MCILVKYVMMLIVNYQRVELIPKIPSGWESIHISGARVASWDGREAVVMTENVSIKEFSVMMIRIFLRSMVRVEIRPCNKEYFFSFCIGGSWKTYDLLQQNYIRANQYQLSIPEHICFTPQPDIGKMHELLLISNKNRSFHFVNPHTIESFNAPASMSELIMQLTQTSFFPVPRSFHERIILKIIQILDESRSEKKARNVKFTNSELEVLHKVALYIEKDLIQHHTIETLTTYSGMNRQKLTTGFKSLFGQPIYTYYLNKRMELAKKILITTELPVKLIAKKVGYKNVANFAIALKKFYGITPGQIRKERTD